LREPSAEKLTNAKRKKKTRKTSPRLKKPRELTPTRTGFRKLAQISMAYFQAKKVEVKAMNNETRLRRRTRLNNGLRICQGVAPRNCIT
jgi:hypothetical protein